MPWHRISGSSKSRDTKLVEKVGQSNCNDIFCVLGRGCWHMCQSWGRIARYQFNHPFIVSSQCLLLKMHIIHRRNRRSMSCSPVPGLAPCPDRGICGIGQLAFDFGRTPSPLFLRLKRASLSGTWEVPAIADCVSIFHTKYHDQSYKSRRPLNFIQFPFSPVHVNRETEPIDAIMR